MPLVAGDGFGGFGGFFFGLVGGAISIAVRMAIAVAIGRSNWYGFAAGGSGQARIGKVCWDGLGYVLQRADLHSSLLGLLQHQLFVDGANLGLLFVGLLAARAVFFGGGQGDVVLEMAHASRVFGVNLERVLVRSEIDALALGVDFVLAVGAVPLGDRCVFVHVFDDLAPADAGVVRAEGDFALLRGVRNDAHFGAAEVIVEQILEPHAGDEEEVPRVSLTALHGIFIGAVGRSTTIFDRRLLRERPGLVEFLEQIVKCQPLRPLERVIVLEQR